MPNDQFLPYAKPSVDITDREEVFKALDSNTITRGPLVEAFENLIAQTCDVKYAVVFNSGTSALMAAYFAAEIGSHDRLITTPNSFVCTTGAGVQRGATPIFLDIDRSSGNFDLQQLEYTISRPASRGRDCIVPVHFSGIPVDMKKIDRMIRQPETIVIEDAAHALGSRYLTGEKVGSCAWSHMTMFSFHPAKIVTTGEGGVITTNDEGYYRRLKLFRNNGIERDPQYLKRSDPWYYEVVDLTGNYNFTEFQAALGMSQMKKLDAFAKKRRDLMKIYRDLLKNVPHLKFFSEEYDEQTAYHLCVVQIDFEACHTTREKVMNQLLEKNIGTQVHYIPIYRHPYFVEKCGEITDYFPEMELYYKQALSLPLYYDLSKEDVERVADVLKLFLRS